MGRQTFGADFRAGSSSKPPDQTSIKRSLLHFTLSDLGDPAGVGQKVLLAYRVSTGILLSLLRLTPLKCCHRAREDSALLCLCCRLLHQTLSLCTEGRGVVVVVAAVVAAVVAGVAVYTLTAAGNICPSVCSQQREREREMHLQRRVEGESAHSGEICTLSANVKFCQLNARTSIHPQGA